MVNPANGHTKLSELIQAALHEAARQSEDPAVIAELATLEVIDTLRHRNTADSKANEAHLRQVLSSSKNGGRNERPPR